VERLPGDLIEGEGEREGNLVRLHPSSLCLPSHSPLSPLPVLPLPLSLSLSFFLSAGYESQHHLLVGAPPKALEVC